MNEPNQPETAGASQEEIMSALFANLIVQQTNMAFMFLGRVPHPETGEVIKDLESAKFFIDQLEMLAFKTKGNLNKREENLLQQSLTGLRMAFVEAIDGGESQPVAGSKPGVPENVSEVAAAPAGPSPASATAPSSDLKSAPPEEESRKKFSKKY